MIEERKSQRIDDHMGTRPAPVPILKTPRCGAGAGTTDTWRPSANSPRPAPNAFSSTTNSEVISQWLAGAYRNG